VDAEQKIERARALWRAACAARAEHESGLGLHGAIHNPTLDALRAAEIGAAETLAALRAERAKTAGARIHGDAAKAAPSYGKLLAELDKAAANLGRLLLKQSEAIENSGRGRALLPKPRFPADSTVGTAAVASYRRSLREAMATVARLHL